MTVTIIARPDRGAAGTATASPSRITFTGTTGRSASVSLNSVANEDWVFRRWTSNSSFIDIKSPTSSTSASVVSIPDDAPDRDVSIDVIAEFLPSGGSEDPPTGYTYGTIVLTVKSDNVAMGTATPTEKITRYGITPPQKFSWVISATANAGYEFDHWEFDGRRQNWPSTYTFTHDFTNYLFNANVVAYFRPVDVRITFYTEPDDANHGTTSPTRIAPQIITAKFGETVTLIGFATAKAGWRFVKWTGSGIPGGLTDDAGRLTFKVDFTEDRTYNWTAKFGPYPVIPSPPPDWPKPRPPVNPVVDPSWSRYIVVNAFVSPDGAVAAGATAYPECQIKTGESGEEVEFTIEATPDPAGDAGSTQWHFDHWEDGDGKNVWSEHIYTFTKTMPSSGGVTYGYTAIYVPVEPKKGFRSLHVWAGVGKSQATGGQKPTEGDVMLGYGSFVVSGGGNVTSEMYARGNGEYVDVESYVEDDAVVDEVTYPVFKDVKFPQITAVNPTDGHCRFVRWEGREHDLSGSWKEITTNETVTHEMLVSSFPNKFWGPPEDPSWKWKLWYPYVQDAHSNSIELRAVFEIARMVIIGYGVNYPTDELKCLRQSDEDVILSETGFHAKGYELFPVFAGHSVFVPFVNDDSESDPPADHIHCKYSIGLKAPHESSGADKSFRSTKHYSGISFTAPSDTSDFIVHTDDVNFRTDQENGWQLTRVNLYYHKLTGMPIADYDPDTGEGSGQLLHDASGQIICDDSACPLEPTT